MGTELEGYLSSKDNFNGILFILREPNREHDHNNQDVFWMKLVIAGEKSGNLASKYKNRLSEVLEAIGLKREDLKNTAFVNINPEGGGAQASEKYKAIAKGSAAKSKCEIYKPQIVFTCRDIFADYRRTCILESGKDIKLENGIFYYRKGKEVQLKRFATEDGTMIYEMFHPARAPELPRQRLENNNPILKTNLLIKARI